MPAAIVWSLAHCAPEELPDPGDWGRLIWKETTVPSNVQTSAYGLKANQLYARDRIHETDWMNRRIWLYGAVFTIPQISFEEEAVFQLKGIDYRCSIYLEDVHQCNGEGCRFLIEELRRKRGRVSGIVWWGVNEPWPALAGNALIDYYGRPKLGWSFLANAYSSTILSIRYDHCVTRAVKPELWISHDGPGSFAGRYEAELHHLQQETALRNEDGREPQRGLLQTSLIERVDGSITCTDGQSAYIRTLPRVRLTTGSRLHSPVEAFLHRGDS